MDIVSIVRHGYVASTPDASPRFWRNNSTVSKFSPHPQSLAALGEDLGGGLVCAVAGGESMWDECLKRTNCLRNLGTDWWS
jgi:hypothetical protein